MKKPSKKIPRNFRLEPALELELRQRSEITGIPETRIVEDALRSYFAGKMSKQLSDTAKKLGKNSHGSSPNV